MAEAVARLNSSSSSISVVVDQECLEDLLVLTHSTELRDYLSQNGDSASNGDDSETSTCIQLSALYRALWIVMKGCWETFFNADQRYLSSHASHAVKCELAAFEIWRYVSSLPEFDHETAVAESSLDLLFITKRKSLLCSLISLYPNMLYPYISYFAISLSLFT